MAKSRAKPLGSGAADYDRVVALEGRHGFAGAKCRQSRASRGNQARRCGNTSDRLPKVALKG